MMCHFRFLNALPAVILSMTAALAVPKRAEREAERIDPAAAKKKANENLERLAKAVLSYTQNNAGRTPPAAIVNKGGKALLSWRVLILPELGEGALFSQFKLDEPWDGPQNRKLLGRMPVVFTPVLGQTAKRGVTHYQCFVGGGAGFERDRGLIYPASFPDGLSNTIMLVEGADPVPWAKPADLPHDPAKPLAKLGGQFADGFHVAMWRGEIRFFKKDFDKREMRNVITRAGGEVMDFSKLER
jgi:hypothetical protein